MRHYETDMHGFSAKVGWICSLREARQFREGLSDSVFARSAGREFFT
jgi:hypothetical protein